MVDTSGLRNVGITTTFIPNRSLYMGGNLALRVNEAETNLQVFDLTTKQTSSFIDVVGQVLTYDFWPVNAAQK